MIIDSPLEGPSRSSWKFFAVIASTLDLFRLLLPSELGWAPGKLEPAAVDSLPDPDSLEADVTEAAAAVAQEFWSPSHFDSFSFLLLWPAEYKPRAG